MLNSRSAIAWAGKKFRTKNISQRVQNIVISPIKEMSILADQFLARNPQTRLISFGQGIPFYDTPGHIKKAIKQALAEADTAKYTLEPGITELRELVAKKYQAKPSEIMISVGCQEAMACALATVLDPGDEVLIPSPTFASHIEQILQFNGKPVFVPLVEKQGWCLSIKEFAKKITKKTRAVLFSNPANPTGAVLSQQELADLVNLARQKDLILIADETYDFLTYDNLRHISLAEFRGCCHPESRATSEGRRISGQPGIPRDSSLRPSASVQNDNLIVCGSFSKKYALTGYRIGYAYAPEGIIDHMLKVHDALAICAPAISQKAVLAALKGPQDCVGRFIKSLSHNRDLMCRELDKMSDIFEYQKPQGAYYILAKYKKPALNSFKLALEILQRVHVITIPGAAFGPTGEGHLRFSFAGEPADISAGFCRLRNFFHLLMA